jgi:hypothetical protein
MSDSIRSFLTRDHDRLGALLECAEAGGGSIDRAAYDEFRAGLLRHVAMEEKVLLPAAQKASGGTPLPVAAELRLQHGAIAALLVPSPTQRIIGLLRRVLAAHNRIEEGPEQLYATCEKLLRGEMDAIMERLRATPEVPVAAYNDGPHVIDSVCRALIRGGFEPEAEELAADRRPTGAH